MSMLATRSTPLRVVPGRSVDLDAAEHLLEEIVEIGPFAEALDDARYQRELGPAPRTTIRDGIAQTLDTFARLQAEGRLDVRELA